MLAWDDSAKVRDAVAGEIDAGRSGERGLARASRRWCCRPASRTAFPSRIRRWCGPARPGSRSSATSNCSAARSREARYVGITGTNGKSTTTALIGHILGRGRTAGRNRRQSRHTGAVAGAARRGRDLCAGGELVSARPDRDARLRCRGAAQHHPRPSRPARRHGRVYRRQAAHLRRARAPARRRSSASTTRSAATSPTELRRAGAARVVPISVTRAGAGRRLCRGRMADRRDRRAAGAGARSRRGRAPAGIAQLAERRGRLCRRARARRRSARSRRRRSARFPASRTARSWSATIDGVRYINDSKATNADATEKALACYDAIYWIARRAAEGRRDHLADAVFRARAARLSDRRRDRGIRGDARRCGAVHALRRSRDRARRRAANRRSAIGVPGAVVLLSPACASYDQFPNFEVRGDTFRELVARVAEAGQAGGHDVRAHRPAADRPLVVDGRPLDLGALIAAGGLRRGDEHGGEPAGRRAARLRRDCISPSASWRWCRSRWRSCSGSRCCRRARSGGSRSSCSRSRSRCSR